MSATIEVTTTILERQTLIEARVGAGSDIPQEIFLYENTGTTELGEFFAVCSLDDYKRFQVWDGTAIPVFANKYVRYGIGRKYIEYGHSAAAVESTFVDNAKKFRLEYQNMTEPVTRSYLL